MSNRGKKEYLSDIVERYFKSSKLLKKSILNEFCSVCNYNRKYAIRLLNHAMKNRCNPSTVKKNKPGRPKKYGHPMIFDFLKHLWIVSNLVCSKRLKVMIPIWLPFYGETIPDNLKTLLLSISPATIDRILQKVKHRYKKLGLSTTKPGSLLRKQIPIKTNQWDETRPGFLEADTVAHCGGSLSGSFIYTVNTTDIATGWIETRAAWGK